MLTAVLYTPLVFLFAKVNFLPTLAQDYVFGAITFLFFWITLSAREPAGDSPANRLARQTARFSYTLYVVHIPLLLLLTAWLVGDRVGSPTDPRHDALALAVLAALMVYAYLVAFITEFRTGKIRVWLERRLGLTRSVRPLSKELVGSVD